MIALAIGLLILMGMSPILGHHVGAELDRTLIGGDHVGDLCLIALHYLLEPVHGGFHLLLLAGLLYATIDRIRSGQTLRRTLQIVDGRAPEPDGVVAEAALIAGVSPDRICVASGLPIPAFTAGWLRPTVYVANRLEAILAREELVAVISHEGAHVRRRDPLRLSAIRFLCMTLFWLPALRRLADDFADEAEILADDDAAENWPLELASALLRLADWRPAVALPADAIGFHKPDLLARRIRRLAGEDVPPQTNVSGRFLAGAGSILLLVWASGAAAAHPLPVGAELHCDHEVRWAWVHLICASENGSAASHCNRRSG